MYQEKSPLQRIAETIIFIGTLIKTLVLIGITIISFGMDYLIKNNESLSDVSMLLQIVGTISIPTLILLWVTRKKAIEGNEGWIYFGMIQGFLTSDWILIIGYFALYINHRTQSVGGQTHTNQTNNYQTYENHSSSYQLYEDSSNDDLFN